MYRAPGRSPDAVFSPGWLGGFALITEQRDVDLPAGTSTLRFEGVAAGMLAESAIISGLPGDVREKNLDAELLSPRNLYARAFGRPVVLRRRDPVNGQVREEPAIIRSGPDGAAVVQTRAGYELANCGFLKDSIAYQGLPKGLNARPTLSVETQSPTARHVRMTLSYLAWGFDWNAHYVLKLAPDGRGATMTAWLTLASGDDTSFPEATTAVVAGKPNFEETRPGRQGGGFLRFDCGATAPWPVAAPAAPPAPPPPPAPMEIMVTASRMMKADYVAQEEALGDLHLYRLPVATTVAAHAQKQVALLADRRVSLQLVHLATIAPDDEGQALMGVRLRNRREDGLGLALPGGRVSLLQPDGAAAVPVGEGRMDDKAEGETFDIRMGASPLVRFVSVSRSLSSKAQRVHVTLTNAKPGPVHVEARLQLGDGDVVAASSRRLGRKDGAPLWVVDVPAHGRAELTYTIRRARP
ncbi:MAG: hypothetical protein KGJ57_09685 [Sphingomonadales bacterium]|nr:hypothetical protein [Sphingomonadales bacterium]MDE2169681.1 hypothetical protein [Sphingomonadales bacterium]